MKTIFWSLMLFFFSTTALPSIEHGEIVSQEELVNKRKTETRTESCTRYSYCYTCRGSGGCKFKASMYCLGKKTYSKDIKFYLYQYKDGFEETVEKEGYEHSSSCS